MKAPLPFYLIVLLALMLQSCSEEPISASSDKFKITFSASAMEDLEGKTLLVTVANSANETFLDLSPLQFTKSGGQYITEELDFPPGNYVINDFVIADDDLIVFAAQRVQGTTSVRFRVGANTDPSPHLELISTTGRNARELGYESFKVRPGGTAGLSVRVNTVGSNDPVVAEALIMQNADTIYRTTLNKRVNRLTFPATSGEQYRLLVAKDGYTLFSQALTGDMMKGGKPVIAELAPAFTMVAKTNPQGNFGVEIDGFPGEIVVDWGDGTSETILLGNPNDIDVLWEHQYSTPGKYFISITGDLLQINTLLFAQGINSATDRINVDQLTELIDFRFMYTDAPDSVDASNLDKLLWFISWSTDVKWVKISADSPPFNVELEDSQYISQESFAGIIDDIYNAEVAGKNVQFVSWAYYPDDPTQEFPILPIGSPTAATLEKMLILQNVYGVDFGPDADYDFGSGDPY